MGSIVLLSKRVTTAVKMLAGAILFSTIFSFITSSSSYITNSQQFSNGQQKELGPVQNAVLSRHKRGYGISNEGFAAIGGLLMGVLSYASLPQLRQRSRRGRFLSRQFSRPGGRCVYRLRD